MSQKMFLMNENQVDLLSTDLAEMINKLEKIEK